MPAPKKYPDELRERAVRLVFESRRPIKHVADDLGVHPEALRSWVRQADLFTAAGHRPRDEVRRGETDGLKAVAAAIGDIEPRTSRKRIGVAQLLPGRRGQLPFDHRSTPAPRRARSCR